MASSPNQVSPRSVAFSNQSTELGGLQDDQNDNWSGEDSGADGDGPDGSKKRKRPMSVSCELCKQRKVKCDRGQPTCGWCARNNQICEYKERKKPGLRAGYGRELEARLDRLEAVIQSQQATLNQLTGGSIALSQSQVQREDPNNFFSASPVVQDRDVSRPNSAAVTPGASIYPVQQDPVQQLRTGFQEYPNGYQSSPHEAYRKTGPPMQQANTSTMYQEPTTNLDSPNLITPPAQHGNNDDEFPTYDLLYGLAELYFKHINTWCPILHRRTTMDAVFGTSSLEEADRIVLHAIVATTLRFSTDARLTPEKRKRHHDISKQKVLLYGLENSSVKALQALVILALDLCGTSNGPPGWNLLAVITRSAVQLGLSIEATSQVVSPKCPSIYTLRAMVLPEPASWIEDESRRRLFWMIYVLDRYATITTAFEFALNEKEIDRKLPCRDDLLARNQPVETKWFRRDGKNDKHSEHPENMGSFSYYVECVAILSKIHLFLKRPIDILKLEDVQEWQDTYRQLDSEITTWKMSLPKEYGNMNRLAETTTTNKIVNCGWVMLNATYHVTIMRLHTSAAYPTFRSHIFAPSQSAGQRCLSAVEGISALCTFVKNNNMVNKLGPPFAFSVWVAARVLLVHSSTIDHQINPNIHFFLSMLRELSQFWKVAERYAALLQRVLDEFADYERAAVTEPNEDRVTPSSVQTLADMRRCAFDLDFLISRQPRQQMATGIRTVTPSQTPAPNALEYLDVFDFFNMPRLPMSTDLANGGSGSAIQNFSGPDTTANNTFNAPDLAVDVNADWFLKPQD